MLAVELKNLLPTVAHDLAALEPPVTLMVATGQECYRGLGRHQQTLRPVDMVMADGQGIISSVLGGSDERTRIGPETQSVLFAVYAPPGIGQGAVARHLDDLRAAVQLFAPRVVVESLEVHGAP